MFDRANHPITNSDGIFENKLNNVKQNMVQITRALFNDYGLESNPNDSRKMDPREK